MQIADFFHRCSQTCFSRDVCQKADRTMVGLTVQGLQENHDDVTLTHLCDVEGCEADSEDDQHRAQQLDSPPPPLSEKTQIYPGIVRVLQYPEQANLRLGLYLLCCIRRRSVSAHIIRKVNATMMTRGRKNSVMVRKSSFERQQPGCWKAVERKEQVTTMANSQTETHTHLATPEFLHRRDASTFKTKNRFLVLSSLRVGSQDAQTANTFYVHRSDQTVIRTNTVLQA